MPFSGVVGAVLGAANSVGLSQGAYNVFSDVIETYHPGLGEQLPQNDYQSYAAHDAQQVGVAQVMNDSTFDQRVQERELDLVAMRQAFHESLARTGRAPVWEWNEGNPRVASAAHGDDDDDWLTVEEDDDDDIDYDEANQRRSQLDELLGDLSNRLRGAAAAPVITVDTFHKAKAVIKFVRENQHSRDAVKVIVKLVQSVAIKKFGSNQHTEQASEYARDRVRKLLYKYTQHEYVNDDFDKFSLVHPECVYPLRSLEGNKIASDATRRLNGGVCNITREEWVSYELLGTNRGNISPIAYAELGYWKCDNCQGHREFHEDTCEHCNSRRQRMEVGKLYSYSTNVRDYVPHLFDVKSKELVVKRSGKGQPKLYFGVELEVIPRALVSQRDALYSVSAAMKEHAIMKSDASLSQGGFEIVTAPATLEYHRERLWNNLFNMKLPNGKKPAELVKSWATTCCGLHIHFTKGALSQMQLNKVLVFYHEPENTRFLSDIAGRSIGPNAPYCKQAKKKLYGRKKAPGQAARTTADDCTYHREAICVSARNGGNTAEVRIFRGNATKHGIMRSIEFVAAIIEWCGVNGAKELNYQSFLSWFDESSNRARYPDLWRHLLSLRYLGTRHKSKNKKVLDELPPEMKAA